MTAPLHLLAGGPASDRRHVTRLLALALASAGCQAPAVAYVGAASGDNAAFIRRIAGLLTDAGAGQVALAPSYGPAVLPRFRGALDAARVVFISGGDVEAGMQTLHTVGTAPLLRQRFEAGVPFIGLSAGSIMLGHAWIAWRDADADTSAYVFPCLGLAPVICDTHAEDDGWSELRFLAARQPARTSVFGITTPAMLRVHPNGRLEAIGGPIHRFEKRDEKVVRVAGLADAGYLRARRSEKGNPKDTKDFEGPTR